MEMDGYFGEKFSRPMCWIDLLLLAEWRTEKSFYIRGNKVIVKRGQIAISTEKLSSRWKISRGTVRKRLQQFVQDNRIAINSSCVVNIITILDYEKYVCGESKETEMQPSLFPELEEDSKSKKRPKTAKHHYAPEVLLTEREFGQLASAYGEEGAKWMVRKLDDYKAARGTTYKSDYRAILNWVVKEYQKQKQHEKATNHRKLDTAEAKRKRDLEFAEYVEKKLNGSGLY